MKKTNIIWILVLIIIALFMIFILGDFASDPASYKTTIEILEEKQANVMTLTAGGAAASTALSALPGDMATPIATQIAEISTYLFAVICIIFLEKYMLTVIGFLVVKILIPLSCALGIIYIINNNKQLRDFVVKILVVSGIALTIVPISVHITTLIEEKNNIEITEVDVDVDIEETEEDKSLWDKLVDSIDGVTEMVENSSELPEKAKTIMVELVDNVAIVLITSCVIPILVMICYFFLFKSIFKFRFEPPHPKLLKKLKDN